MSRILDLLPGRFTRKTTGDSPEFAGPCPFCGGHDRLCVWPEKGESGRFWCRGCEEKGDGIDLHRKRTGSTFAEACEALGLGYKVRHAPAGDRPAAKTSSAAAISSAPSAMSSPEPVRLLAPPPSTWRQAALAFIEECEATLWSDAGAEVRALLHARGLADETIRAARLGCNPAARYPLRTAWGIEPKEGKPKGGKVWLPRGIVIPWFIDGELWKVNIRRPDEDLGDGPRYVQAAGSSEGLFNADAPRLDFPAVLVEGEIDALSIQQAAGDVAAAVATGSTHSARRTRWIALLSAASDVLVAFDAQPSGEAAAPYWLENLPNARRWRPYWGDPNDLLREGADLREWVLLGLGRKGDQNVHAPASGASSPADPAAHYAARYGADELAALDVWDEPTRRLILWLWWFGQTRAGHIDRALEAGEIVVGDMPIDADTLARFIDRLTDGPEGPEAEAVRLTLPRLCAALAALEQPAALVA